MALKDWYGGQMQRGPSFTSFQQSAEKGEMSQTVNPKTTYVQ